MSTEAPFDPFQVFEVSHKNCAVLYVKIIRGRKITKGWAKDLMDVPDPYVILNVANSPHAWRKTSVKDNDINPEWHETFTFWLDPDQKHTLEMSLMDANYMVDEHLASRSLNLNPLPIGKKMKKTIQFNETSEVDIEVWAEINEKPDLRFSLMLCNEEKNFIEARKRKILRAMKNHFGFASPRNYKEVPVIGIIGSGGGFRAMTAYSGVVSALSELGVLDMATYIGGLSGSAWYLSQLYSHPEWPNISPRDQREEIRKNIDHSFLWLFRSHGVTFAKEVWKKRSRGEPVSFTDLFGHLVGNTLLKDRLDAKLSHQKRCINDGQCPLPLYTCLHVKKSVSAMIFHEWMEFSPFEVGMAKYGTFMKSEQFACKFFMGSIIRDFPEPPLHFLQGIWGSAFCIQFKRLLQDDKNVDPVELMRREREELQEELKKDIDVCDVEDSESSDDENINEKGTHGEKTTGGLQRRRSKSTKLKQKSFWDSMMSRILESRWFQSIELRAAQVFNFMRGLSLNNVYPFSPFTQTQEEEEESNKTTFGSIFDLHPTHIKKLYVVDSGLTFNSPYPVLLRPQREVDIILSFDFSARPSDDTPPFKELLLAAKWAELNKVPFPPIDPTVVQREGLKECYVFKHPWDPNCPIVIHFCLININFKREIRPGVARTTQEELDFGNFSIFDDRARPYSTFKFTYTHQEFDRLSKLMEYNTLYCKDIIFENISTCIKRRRRFSIRRPCTKKDIARLSLNSKIKAEKLAEYITMVEKVSGLTESVDLSTGSEPIKAQNPLSASVGRERYISAPKTRPLSSPVNMLEDAASNEDFDEIKNTKLQRSTVSLRGNIQGGRRRLVSGGMSQVEEVDEQDERPGSNGSSPRSSPKSSPRTGKRTLVRSRPISASMRPNLVSEKTCDELDSPDVPSIVESLVNDNDYENMNDGKETCPMPSPRHKRRLKMQGAESDSQNGKHLTTNNNNNNTAQSNKGVGEDVCPVPVTNRQGQRKPLSADAMNKNGAANGASNLIVNGLEDVSTKDQPIEKWIDSAERVTDL